MRKFMLCSLALLLILALTACGGGTDTAETTAAPATDTPVTTTAPVTTAAPETADPNAPALSAALTGYYTCGDATLELFNLGGVQYGEMSNKAADGTVSYWGLVIEPVNPGDLEKAGVTETRVRISLFSAEELGGSLIGDPAAYTVALTADGVDFCDHTTGSPLIEGNDVDLAFKRTDAPKPAASALTFDAAAVKAAGLPGMWVSQFSDGKGVDYDVTLCFRENGRMFCRIEVTGQVPNIWVGDYALPSADSGLSSNIVLCQVTRKGANKMVWPVRVTFAVKGDRAILGGVHDMNGASLLNLSATLTPTEDTAVIPTLGE